MPFLVEALFEDNVPCDVEGVPLVECKKAQELFPHAPLPPAHVAYSITVRPVSAESGKVLWGKGARGRDNTHTYAAYPSVRGIASGAIVVFDQVENRIIRLIGQMPKMYNHPGNNDDDPRGSYFPEDALSAATRFEITSKANGCSFNLAAIRDRESKPYLVVSTKKSISAIPFFGVKKCACHVRALRIGLSERMHLQRACIDALNKALTEWAAFPDLMELMLRDRVVLNTECLEFMHPVSVTDMLNQKLMERGLEAKPIAKEVVEDPGAAGEPRLMPYGASLVSEALRHEEFSDELIDDVVRTVGVGAPITGACSSRDRMKFRVFASANEGFVVKYYDEEGALVAAEKRKTPWYVLKRALRERIRSVLRSRRDQTFTIHGASSIVMDIIREKDKFLGLMEAGYGMMYVPWYIMLSRFAFALLSGKVDPTSISCSAPQAAMVFDRWAVSPAGLPPHMRRSHWTLDPDTHPHAKSIFWMDLATTDVMHDGGDMDLWCPSPSPTVRLSPLQARVIVLFNIASSPGMGTSSVYRTACETLQGAGLLATIVSGDKTGLKGEQKDDYVMACVQEMDRVCFQQDRLGVVVVDNNNPFPASRMCSRLLSRLERFRCTVLLCHAKGEHDRAKDGCGPTTRVLAALSCGARFHAERDLEGTPAFDSVRMQRFARRVLTGEEPARHDAVSGEGGESEAAALMKFESTADTEDALQNSEHLDSVFCPTQGGMVVGLGLKTAKMVHPTINSTTVRSPEHAACISLWFAQKARSRRTGVDVTFDTFSEAEGGLGPEYTCLRAMLDLPAKDQAGEDARSRRLAEFGIDWDKAGALAASRRTELGIVGDGLAARVIEMVRLPCIQTAALYFFVELPKDMKKELTSRFSDARKELGDLETPKFHHVTLAYTPSMERGVELWKLVGTELEIRLGETAIADVEGGRALCARAAVDGLPEILQKREDGVAFHVTGATSRGLDPVKSVLVFEEGVHPLHTCNLSRYAFRGKVKARMRSGTVVSSAEDAPCVFACKQ